MSGQAAVRQIDAPILWLKSCRQEFLAMYLLGFREQDSKCPGKGFKMCLNGGYLEGKGGGHSRPESNMKNLWPCYRGSVVRHIRETEQWA